MTSCFSHTVRRLAAPMLLVAGALSAQDSAKPNGDLPLATTRKIQFTTDEGTWISLDVSPDGKTIVFELLGNLYTMPITGGKATRITSGTPFDWQPRYSPDGKSIVFVSDRSGSQNLWFVDPDGKHPRAFTANPATQYMSPEWSPDGNYIVVSQAAKRGATYELQLIDLRGGSGVRMTGAGQSGMGATFGGDGRYVYYSSGYPSLGGSQVHRLDRTNGTTSSVTNARGGGLRPVVSPDGRYLVYATRRDTATSLIVRDMTTGEQHTLVAVAARDQQEKMDLRDLMPGSAFTPDSRALITSYAGKIWRVEIPKGTATIIPFTADVDLDLGPLVRTDYPHSDSNLVVRQIRDARPSADGRRIAFVALDRLWVADLDGTASEMGTQIRNARRLTSANVGEFSPAWSPRGDYIAYVTWGELDGGAIQRIPVAGGSPERLTRDSAFYDQLNYTPDGSRLVAVRMPRALRVAPVLERTASHSIDLVWIASSCPTPSALGCAAPTTITPLTEPGYAHFSRDTSRIYITQGGTLVSLRWDGSDRRSVLKMMGRGAGPAEIVLSPTGDHAIAMVDNNVFITSVPPVGGEMLTLNAYGGSVPARRLSRVAAEFAGWRADGLEAHFSLGKSYFRYDVNAAEAAIRDSITRTRAPKDTTKKDSARAPDTAQKGDPKSVYEPARYDLVITAARDRPKGVVALRGARIITMKGNEVIENGDILVRDNRIVAVGKRGSVAIPADAKTIDVNGKTIIPGWVDIHASMSTAAGVHRSQVWEYLAQLAYGVTTARDAETASSDVVAYADLVEAGSLLGPRIFATGPAVGSPSVGTVSSPAEAKEILRRYSEFWQTETITQLGAGERNVRQWLVMAAKELGLTPTAEGNGEMTDALTVMVDGYPGQDGNLTVWPIFKDVIELTAKSGITYTPTLLNESNAAPGRDYFFTHFDVHDDAKLRRFTPHAVMDEKTLRRQLWTRDDQFGMRGIAADAVKILAAGGRVGLGGNGELQGLGIHWELQALASGGIAPHDLLRVGTIYGAEAIGHGKDFGSIEVGKLADLQVLDKNPLLDIRNTMSIRYVMKNGRLYDATTLDEIWPRTQKLGRLSWETE